MKKVHATSLTSNLPDDPLIKSFGSICPTFPVSLWSSKQNCVLYLSKFHLGFPERILLQRIEKTQQKYF